MHYVNNSYMCTIGGINQTDVEALGMQILTQHRFLTRNMSSYNMTSDRAHDTGDNLRVVFIGDSLINKAQEMFLMLDQISSILKKAHPVLSFELLNKGINGNKILDIRLRLYRDCLNFNPDAVVVYWDSDASDVDESLMSPLDVEQLRQEYTSNLQYVLARLVSSGAKVFLSGPTLLGERPHGQNFDDVKLDWYRATNKDVCAEYGVEYIDTRRAFFNALPHVAGESLCGLPVMLSAALSGNGISISGAGMIGCWMSKLLTGGMNLVLSSTGRLFRAAERWASRGHLTLDGEHLNKNGVAIAVQLFSAALDSWLSSRDPIGSVVIDSWEHFSGDLGFSTSRFPQPRDMIAALHDMRLRVLLSVSPVWSNQSLSYLQSTSLGGGDRVGVVGAKRGLWLTRRDVETKAVLDISDSAAVSWLTSRLSALRASTNVDGFILSAPTGEDERTLASITSSASSENLYYNSTAVLMAGGYTPLLSLVLQDVLRGAL